MKSTADTRKYSAAKNKFFLSAKHIIGKIIWAKFERTKFKRLKFKIIAAARLARRGLKFQFNYLNHYKTNFPRRVDRANHANSILTPSFLSFSSSGLGFSLVTRQSMRFAPSTFTKAFLPILV